MQYLNIPWIHTHTQTFAKNYIPMCGAGISKSLFASKISFQNAVLFSNLQQNAVTAAETFLANQYSLMSIYVRQTTHQWNFYFLPRQPPGPSLTGIRCTQILQQTSKTLLVLAHCPSSTKHHRAWRTTVQNSNIMSYNNNALPYKITT